MKGFIFFEESWNLESDEACTLENKCNECLEETGRCVVRQKTASELHEAMMKDREKDFDDELFDPIESELDVYNL